VESDISSRLECFKRWIVFKSLAVTVNELIQ
jgi:hypothetical protein